MAVVKGVKEKVHLPLYDSIEVRPGKQFRDVLTSNVIRFFVDVTAKTKLLTNMQAASLLPHWNTFEARALRVVISDLSPKFGAFPDVGTVTVKGVRVESPTPVTATTVDVSGFNVDLLLEFARQLEISKALAIRIPFGELGSFGLVTNPVLTGGTVVITRSDLAQAEALLRADSNGRLVPPAVQIFPRNGFGNVIGNFIYNTVTTFFVGEKIMIQVPTWFFPAGAGPYAEDGNVVTHGYPNPQATFRFAEPVMIDTQQNFRVEIEVPDGDVLGDLQRLYGPLFIWVTLDGYMTRDVQ